MIDILQIRSVSQEVIRWLPRLTLHRRICLQDIVELLEYMKFVHLWVFPKMISLSI